MGDYDSRPPTFDEQFGFGQTAAPDPAGGCVAKDGLWSPTPAPPAIAEPQESSETREAAYAARMQTNYAFDRGLADPDTAAPTTGASRAATEQYQDLKEAKENCERLPPGPAEDCQRRFGSGTPAGPDGSHDEIEPYTPGPVSD